MMTFDPRAPIPATCGQCGGDAVILPDPAPRGTFHCPACFARRMREWNAFVNGRATPQSEITELERHYLDGDR